jgi:hypothetical protein
LDINFNWTGNDLERAITDDLKAKCSGIIGEVIIKTLFMKVDNEYNKMRIDFNVTVDNTTYHYVVKSINSTTEIDYNSAIESGTAVTTLASRVEVSSNITLSANVKFVVKYSLLLDYVIVQISRWSEHF